MRAERSAQGVPISVLELYGCLDLPTHNKCTTVLENTIFQLEDSVVIAATLNSMIPRCSQPELIEPLQFTIKAIKDVVQHSKDEEVSREAFSIDFTFAYWA